MKEIRDKGKRENIEKRILEFINNVLDVAEENKSIDFINLEISNHNGSLQMDYKIRGRDKVY